MSSIELEVVQPSDDGYGEVNLQDLLKAQQRVRSNVNVAKDAEARQTAIRRFGLVESADGGTMVKQLQADNERLTARVEQLERELAGAKATAPAVPTVPAMPQTSPNAVPAEPTVVVASAKTTGVPAAADPASAPAPTTKAAAPKAPTTPAAPAAPAGEVNPFAK